MVPLTLSGLQHASEDRVLHRAAGADGNAGQRIFGDRDGQAGLVAQFIVQTLQQRAAASQNDPLIHNVRRQFRRSIFQSDPDTLNDGADRFRQRVGDLALVDGKFPWARR